MAVPGSPPPAETPPPQGLSTPEKLQCQANKFLNAIFRKKGKKYIFISIIHREEVNVTTVTYFTIGSE